MSDKEFTVGLKKSDERVFEKLFRHYVTPLSEYAFFYLKDRQLAEDIVQDLFVKLWENRQSLEIHSSLKAYLYRSTHNSCIQFLRYKTVSDKHEKFLQTRLREAKLMNQLYFENGITNLFEKEIVELVNQSLEKLSPKTSEIFRLSRRKYLKNSEIAKRFNLSEKSIEYHITKALEVLKIDLKDYLLIVVLFLN